MGILVERFQLLWLPHLIQSRMSGSEASGQLALLQQHQPFQVTEELLPALLGKLVKLVQENDIKTDADMDKTIDKAAGEVLEEASSKAKVESKANVETGKDNSKEKNKEKSVKKEKDIKAIVLSNGSKINEAMEAEEDQGLKGDSMKTQKSKKKKIQKGNWKEELKRRKRKRQIRN